MFDKYNKSLNYSNLILPFMLMTFVIIASSCKSDKKAQSLVAEEKKEIDDKKDTPEQEHFVKEVEVTKEEILPKPEKKTESIPFEWKEITTDDGIIIDIKYASAENFTKKKIYDCGRCFLRPEAITVIKTIHQELQSKLGYGLKIFDCFRPRPYQQKLWDAVPDPDYVTPPAKGSMHSRGLAVDLTIVDKNGDELDMGTPFDYFGEEAHQDYTGHSVQINQNRALLKSTMEKYGFKSIRTEWWHYSYRSKSYPLDSWVWDCR